VPNTLNPRILTRAGVFLILISASIARVASGQQDVTSASPGIQDAGATQKDPMEDLGQLLDEAKAKWAQTEQKLLPQISQTCNRSTLLKVIASLKKDRAEYDDSRITYLTRYKQWNDAELDADARQAAPEAARLRNYQENLARDQRELADTKKKRDADIAAGGLQESTLASYDKLI
jgi:hypothetical protein